MTMISDRLTDEQLAEILSGVVEGVEPTTQELAMAAELQERRKVDSTEPDYICYDCGCCGWKTIDDWRDNDVCPKCNHKPMGKTELFTTPPAPVIPSGLHPDTKMLVTDFCTDLAEKLYKAQLKYGYDADWKQDNWSMQCLAHFHQHIAKGDPRDVAAYCAFMWYHGWKTEPATTPVVPEKLPCPVHLVPGLRFGKGVSTQTMLEALQRRAAYYAELDAMTPEERAEHYANIEAFKAMLPPPVPVVPDEITSASAPEVFEMAAEAERLGLCGAYASYAVGWNACRAAMLQGK